MTADPVSPSLRDRVGQWLEGLRQRFREGRRRAAGWLDANVAPLIVAVGVVSAWAFKGVRLVHVPEYLAAIVGLETTAVAIMVPVALDVAFRVYEEYRSRIVRVYLLRERRLTWLVLATFLNAVAALASHVMYSWNPANRLFVPVTVFATIEAAGVVVMLLAYLRHLRDRVLSEPDWLIDQLADDAMRDLSERGPK